jgi:hypothetical protein
MEEMKAGVAKARGGVTLFGGEALLVPEKDLEELLSGVSEVREQRPPD